MDKATEFKNIVAQYSNLKAEEITDEMRFREDLGLSSLDFMSLLGELEDTFDVELEQEEVLKVLTVGDALKMLEEA
jgi:acyl carrier protein